MDKIECLLCGKKFVRLLSHVRQTHKISSTEYREAFGIPKNVGLIPESHKELLRSYINKDTIERITKLGEKTRFKKGGEQGKYERTPEEKKRLQRLMALGRSRRKANIEATINK